MATKPYAGGGAYINRMSDHCRRCRYVPTPRPGDDACPYTTLYWDFLDRQRARFERNPRMVRSVRGLDRLTDISLNEHDQEHTEREEQRDRVQYESTRGQREPAFDEGQGLDHFQDPDRRSLSIADRA